MTTASASVNIGNRQAERARLTVPWWLAICPSVLFVMLGIICHGPNTLGVDLELSHWVQDRNTIWADPLAFVGNTIGEAPVAIGLLVVSVALGAMLKRWRELWFLLIVAIGRLLAVFLKGMFDSPRPTREQVRLYEVFDGYGFPSGHTLTATLVAGTLAFLLTRRAQNPTTQAALGLCWLGAIACTAFARIWVGAHWFTDTLGGALFGVFIVLLTANLSATLAARWPGPSATSG